MGAHGQRGALHLSACLLIEKKKIHVASCYAPTRAANREEKDKFLEKLDNMLSLIPEDDMYVILGDFNAALGPWRSNRISGAVSEDHMVMGAPTKRGRNYLPSWLHTKLSYATRGSKRRGFTWKPGNTQSQRNGTALTTL